jgi:hypothetical protein
MNLLGIHLTFLIGPTIPVPAPPILTEALQSIEVTHTDEGRSGFQISFQTGRSGLESLLDYPLLKYPLLKPFNRIALIVIFNATPRVLMDGIITHQQLSPGSSANSASITITGEDVSVMMDLEERSEEHPGQTETVIALKIIGSYAQYGLIPKIIPPPSIDVPLPIERIPTQQSTDLEYLRDIAERFGYVFYVTPGPAPLTNTAYWGPPVRVGVPQKALSVDMGPETNVETINFRYNSLLPTLVSGWEMDRRTNISVPVQTFSSFRIPLASQPALSPLSNSRQTQFRQSSLDMAQAFSRAQGMTDASVDDVIIAEGELNALHYGDLLRPMGLVGLRGAGYSYDGFWYVKRVTHKIRKEEYTQSFTLSREGLGSLTPMVPP